MASARKLKTDPETLAKENVPLAMRDYCSHLLIPLNQCRRDTFYLPWKCSHERHAYEICQHKEYLSRRRAKIESEIAAHKNKKET